MGDPVALFGMTAELDSPDGPLPPPDAPEFQALNVSYGNPLLVGGMGCPPDCGPHLLAPGISPA
jgi:hypothetical protein